MTIHAIRADHGGEFGTDFAWHLHDLGNRHRHIPRARPDSNGKVERIHWTDEEECSRRVRFRTLEALQLKLRAWKHGLQPPPPMPQRKRPTDRLYELESPSPTLKRKCPDYHAPTHLIFPSSRSTVFEGMPQSERNR